MTLVVEPVALCELSIKRSTTLPDDFFWVTRRFAPLLVLDFGTERININY